MPKKRGGAYGDDDEDDVQDEDFGAELEDDDDDDDDDRGKGKARKRKGAEFFDEDAEEDDEEEEDDNDKRRNKKQRNVFIDDIAEVDDEEEEEEIDDDAEDIIDDRDEEIPDAAAVPLNYTLRHEDDHAQEEDILRRIEERYKEYQGDEMPETLDTGMVGQQGLLPTPNDPKLWMVTVKIGHEREAVVQLLQKVYTMNDRGQPLHILSAVALDHLKGLIYIEATKESHVRDAIRGLRTVYGGKGATLVPLNEMVDALTVNREVKDALARDAWVRVRSGLYKDDLAKVVDVDHISGRAVIRLLHRLDFGAMANKTEEQRKKNPFGRAPVVRPAPKVFNPEDARGAGLLVQRLPAEDRMQSYQVNTHRFVGGYLQRNVGIKSLIVLDSMPSLDEVGRFNAAASTGDDDAAPSGDLSSLMATLPTDGSVAPKGTFAKGDKVKIIKGDLENLDAVVTGVTAEGKVMARPAIKGFNEEVEFEPEELNKVFEVGTRVRVLSGQHAGDTGMVVRVDDAMMLCYLISDTTKEEVKAFARDLTESAVVASQIEMLGEYQLHDLVQLNATTAGIIVKIERDAAQVLTSNGTPEKPDIRVARVTDIMRKVHNKQRPTAKDKSGNVVRENDFVTVTQGPCNGKGGNVAHIWNGTLFLQSRQFADYGGYTVAKAFACQMRGGSNLDRANQILGTPGSGTPRSTPGGGTISSSPGGSMYSSNTRSSLAFVPMSPRVGVPTSAGAGGGGGPGGSQAGSYGADGRFQFNVPSRPGQGAQAGRGHGPQGAFSGRANGAQAHSHHIGKRVLVVKGPYNGYKGRVKQQTATHLQLELDAVAGRHVTIPIEYIDLGGGSGAGGYGGGGGRGPGGYGGGGRGPGSAGSGAGDGRYPPQTPSHGGMPPQTPAHYSMTPAHPSMTPSHAPYTPAHAPYTPAHPTSGENDYDYGYDSRQQPMSAPTPGYGGTAYTPQQQAFTPALTPQGFTPQEQGSMHAPTPQGHGTYPGVASTPNVAATPGMAHTPYLPAHTPGAGMETAPTPGGNFDHGFTPAGTSTPGLPAQTPGMPNAFTPAFTPANAYTPGTPGFDAGTPMPGVGVIEDYSTWVHILVKLPGGGDGVVRTAQVDGTCSVQPGNYSLEGGFVAEGGLVNEDAKSLSVVRPLKRDKVKIIKADAPELLGVMGTLIGIDNTDGIVKCDGTSDMKILDMGCLAKVVV